MRTKLALATLGLGVAAALLPAAPASASCIHVDDNICVGHPGCYVALVGNTVLTLAGSDERLYCPM